MTNEIKQILRKEIKREVKNKKEFIENEYHEKQVLEAVDIDNLRDYFDDYEAAYEAGIGIDYNDDIVWIDIDALSEEIYRQMTDEDVELTDFQNDMLHDIHKKLRKWKGFKLWIY